MSVDQSDLGTWPLLTWHLTADAVPEPPRSEGITWFDVLRWLIVVLDRDDEGIIEFCASVLSQGLRRGYLTKSQSRAVERIWRRTLDRHRHGILECQVYQDQESLLTERTKT